MKRSTRAALAPLVRRRLAEIETERAELLAFLSGREPGRRGRRAQNSEAAEVPLPRAHKRRRRPKMSAAARKAVSERMRKYWESRRQSKGSKRKASAKEQAKSE